METTINGVKTNYQVFGDKVARDFRVAESPDLGKPFLILHGWGSNSDRWVSVAEKISEKGFKVYVPDLPGFGKSDALTTAWNMNNYVNWLENLVKELNLNEFYLMGHSFGGALAVKLTIKHAQDVKKLFLVSAASVRKKTTKKWAYKNISKIVKPFSFFPFYEFFRKAFYKFVIRKSDYVYVEGVMKETFKNVVFEDLSQFTGFIRTPTVIIWGDKDKSTPIEDAYFMNGKIKNSKLIVLNGFGHILNRDCPEILAEKILENT